MCGSSPKFLLPFGESLFGVLDSFTQSGPPKDFKRRGLILDSFSFRGSVSVGSSVRKTEITPSISNNKWLNRGG